ncbi:YpiB family protein [Neobacillus ginsengisoli]|uniref:Uncharacterized protein YpiB (UPF0302 family) n=1 Tax=Neobacillus ginsengisoli TaxID=904295 RepID=A0ABT9XW74_9BACI|nr:YpiB family protein [Neobacillus ginsengisoli]MDQ0199820.1 uncharacterized protein YpiB (UPF0302 family) [Neobacillus ginsengisoli]
MKKWVSSIEKGNFLKWFLENNRLKRTDARRIIEYIINHFPIIENVTFTEKVIQGEKNIVISSVNSDEPAFVYYYKRGKTEDVSMVLNQFMMNPSEKVNIIIHFSGKMLNHQYLQLIEKDLSSNIRKYEQSQRDANEVDKLIGKVIQESEKELLRKQIDVALDQKNEELFIKLVKKLKEQDH